MEITTHSLWTVIHGMGFGALYLLAGSGALFTVYQRLRPAPLGLSSLENNRFLGAYLSLMAALAWLAVLSGTYIIYPWYRSLSPRFSAGTSCHERLALGWNGMEGARGMAGADCDHGDGVRRAALWSRTLQASSTADRPFGVREQFSYCRGDRSILWCDARQERSRGRRPDNSSRWRGKAMTLRKELIQQDPPLHPNGPAAAAILAAGIGSISLAIITIAADQSAGLKTLLTFYKPTGPLSGVTTTALGVWVLTWLILDRLWHRRELPLRKINIACPSFLELPWDIPPNRRPILSSRQLEPLGMWSGRSITSAHPLRFELKSVPI